MRKRFHARLRASVAASAAPYGYTLTVWSSGMVSSDVLGPPHVGHVFLFVAGAVLAFITIEACAYGTLRPRLATGHAPVMAVWGNAHIGSAGGALLAVWGLDSLIDGPAAWPVAGFAATALYLLVNSLQATLASEVSEDM